MKNLGVFFSVKQAQNKSGIVRAFDVFSDGLFSAPDLGKFGLKHWRFKEMFHYSTYATLDDGDDKDQA